MRCLIIKYTANFILIPEIKKTSETVFAEKFVVERKYLSFPLSCHRLFPSFFSSFLRPRVIIRLQRKYHTLSCNICDSRFRNSASYAVDS